jgi:hypothetical protein
MANFLRKYAKALNDACSGIVPLDMDCAVCPHSHLMLVTFKRDDRAAASLMHPVYRYTLPAPWRASVHLFIRQPVGPRERGALCATAATAFDEMVSGLKCPRRGWVRDGGNDGHDLVASYNLEFVEDEEWGAGGAVAGYAVVSGSR